MVKVYLPSLAICTLSLSVNLLFLGTYSSRAIARESVSPTSNEQAANVEPEILAEINRVRTNPQGYAQWLEEQKQYYDNIWLRLPGEEPVRAHKLSNAIDEAIAILKKQQPLPPLDISKQTSAIATQKLENFGTTNNNIQNISYGRKTAEGIVMSLVVDELFRDRRRRKSLLSPDANDTGIVCESDPRYAKVCAIAYSNSTVDDPVEKQPEATPSAETEIVKQPETEPEETETSDESKSSTDAEPAPVNEPTIEDTDTDNSDTGDTETVAEQLPQPPQPQAPQAPVDEPEPDLPSSEAESEEKGEVEIARVDAEDEEELEEVEQEIEEVEQELEEIEQEIEEEGEKEEKEEVFEAESEDLEEEVATNSDSSRLLENVERGALEEGDRVIEEDGSFYDSYPLEAQSGESFTIALESDEFDAFVALIDSQGNIVEQNDDISEEDSNSRIRVTIPENGVYNVIVNAYDEGGTGQYVLTVTR